MDLFIIFSPKLKPFANSSRWSFANSLCLGSTTWESESLHQDNMLYAARDFNQY